MSYPKSIPVLFGEVVTAAMNNKDNAGLTLLEQLQAAKSTIQTINYQYGPIKELMETLDQMKQGRTKIDDRFPLVWLVEDITVDRRNQKGFYGDVSLRVVIAYPTKAEYKSSQRETITFDPILRPIYWNLLYAISVHGGFNSPDREHIPHRVTERKHWGSDNQAATELTTYVDAIDIQNLELKVNYQYCSTPIN